MELLCAKIAFVDFEREGGGRSEDGQMSFCKPIFGDRGPSDSDFRMGVGVVGSKGLITLKKTLAIRNQECLYWCFF
jgi:hypothetical protein